MSILREAISFYLAKKREEKEKKKLLNAHSDWTMIEYFVQQMNENPNLRIDIHLRDRTTIQMRCFEEKRSQDKIDGNYMEIQ